MKKYLIVISVLLNALTCYGQTPNCPVRITQSEVSYRNYFSNSSVTHLSYMTLENRTTDAFYFWIGRIVSKDTTPERLFFAYFYGKKDNDNAVSFGDLVTDGTNILSGYGIKEIGYNFIKLLKPGENLPLLCLLTKLRQSFLENVLHLWLNQI